MRLPMTVLAATLAVSVPVAYAQPEQTAPAPIQETNRALVENAFARWAAGEADIFALLADDAIWQIAGQDPDIAKTYRSRQDLLDATAVPLRARLAGPLEPSVLRIWADGDDVLVHWEGTAPMLDGSTYRNSYLWVMTVRDDRVVAVTAFLDNAAFKAALSKPLASHNRK